MATQSQLPAAQELGSIRRVRYSHRTNVVHDEEFVTSLTQIAPEQGTNWMGYLSGVHIKNREQKYKATSHKPIPTYASLLNTSRTLQAERQQLAGVYEQPAGEDAESADEDSSGAEHSGLNNVSIFCFRGSRRLTGTWHMENMGWESLFVRRGASHEPKNPNMWGAVATSIWRFAWFAFRFYTVVASKWVIQVYWRTTVLTIYGVHYQSYHPERIIVSGQPWIAGCRVCIHDKEPYDTMRHWLIC